MNGHIEPQTILMVDDLHVSFRVDDGLFEAVKGISFRLSSGQTLALVGESGSGKSVTALSLMGLLPKRTALVRAKAMHFDGISIHAADPASWKGLRGNRMAMIFQEPMTSLNPVMRCGPQVAEALMQYQRISRPQAYKKVIELFDNVKLPRSEQLYHAWPHQLSGGQRQRVMIAMALANNPKLLIADEPTTALDLTVQKEILQLLSTLKAQYGMAMIFITHDLGVVADIADHVAVMQQGQIVEHGNTHQLLSNPQHPYTTGLLACRPPLNKRYFRLPVVSEFIDGSFTHQGQLEQRLILSPELRKQRHNLIYKSLPLIEVRHLSVHYRLRAHQGQSNTIRAVDDLSFDIYPGETLGLVGESGSGKTTLGRALLRLIKLHKGEIFYRGANILNLNRNQSAQLRRKMQIVFQDPFSSLNPRMTIGEAIREPMQAHGLNGNRKNQIDKVFELLERVGLDHMHYHRYPHEFSGGQRQRIGIARALAVQPEFMVLDEPVSALDVSVQAQVLNLLGELKEKFGLTYLFISHDLGVVRYFSDRIMVMHQGKIVETDEADQLFSHPQQAYTRKLISALPGLQTT